MDAPRVHPRIFGPNLADGPVEDMTRVLSGAVNYALETGYGRAVLPMPLSPVWRPAEPPSDALAIDHVTLVAAEYVTETRGGPPKRWRAVRFASQGDLDRYRAWLKRPGT